MKWITRKRIHVNRTATAWLIRRFLDANAEIIFVEPNEVAALQQRENAIGFDARTPSASTRLALVIRIRMNAGGARSNNSWTSISRMTLR